MFKTDTVNHREEVKQKIKDLLANEYEGYEVTPVFKEVLLKEVISDFKKDTVIELNFDDDFEVLGDSSYMIQMQAKLNEHFSEQQREYIEWYADHEDDEVYVWNFELGDTAYKLVLDKDTEAVELEEVGTVFKWNFR